jgi:cytoskeleton protein RodZ
MPPERPSGGFGERLRDARERRGVSLRQIANSTKISVGVLEALERDDISRLPGGIFGRAFVRSYAIEVGLDPEATIQAFIAQFPNESVTAGHPTSDRGEDKVAVESSRLTAGTFLVLIAISVPVAAGVLYFATLGRQPTTEPPPRAAATPAPETRPPAEPPRETAPVSPAVTEAAASDPASPPPAPDARPAVSTAADDQLTVALTATRQCWVSATVDGRKTIERLLVAGEQQTLIVRRDLVLTAGDATAITMQLNGLNARLPGRAGEVVTARFSLSNFKDYLRDR